MTVLLLMPGIDGGPIACSPKCHPELGSGSGWSALLRYDAMPRQESTGGRCPAFRAMHWKWPILNRVQDDSIGVQIAR
jgi:hypothetical protein